MAEIIDFNAYRRNSPEQAADPTRRIAQDLLKNAPALFGQQDMGRFNKTMQHRIILLNGHPQQSAEDRKRSYENTLHDAGLADTIRLAAALLYLGQDALEELKKKLEGFDVDLAADTSSLQK